MVELTIRLPQHRVSLRVSLEVGSRAGREELDLVRAAKKSELLQQAEKDISRSRELFLLAHHLY